MTTGRINQVARPPRRAGTATARPGPRGSRRWWPARLSYFWGTLWGTGHRRTTSL